jgi:hypothetical protein
MVRQTLRKFLECFDLFVIFVFFSTVLQFCQSKVSLMVIKNIFFFFPSLLFIPPFTFLSSACYGSVFLKLRSQRATVDNFLRLGLANFFKFLKIEIIIAIIILCSNLLVEKVFYKHILDVTTSVEAFIFLSSCISELINLIVNVLFVFAYPLVIIGYFSGKKIAAIKMSLILVVKKINEIYFIILVFFLNLVQSVFLRWLISSEYMLYRNILISLITSSLLFLILIYSYLLLTEGRNEVSKRNKVSGNEVSGLHY